MNGPTVTVVIPTYQEERHIERTLQAVRNQTYPKVVEVLVVDGRSDDRTRELAAAFGATVHDNPRRIQAAGLNVGIEAAVGDVIVRVDGHCTIAADYVERCVDALERTDAAMVGGAMTPVAARGWQRAIALAMSSPIGAGPARFHVGGRPGWVDTVYLGAYRTEQARAAGGYELVAQNEDAEFAIRLGAAGGVWFDPTIRSEYTPRDSLPAVARQFWRYGRSRAATVRRHPRSLAWRQLAAPLLVLCLLSPWRRRVLTAYMAIVAAETARQTARAGSAGLLVAPVLPAMHVPWGLGFLLGVARRS
ncbi:MAG: glycosyltransferase family 2 protein [Ilumatobacteraceae bacterium]